MAANPYVEARREWDERYGDLVLGKRNWQITAGGLLVVTLILASGIVWLTTRSRYIPYVVEVDKLGYSLTVPQPLTPSSVPDVTARMQRYEVAAFIRNARAVSIDPQVEHEMLNSLLAHRADMAWALYAASHGLSEAEIESEILHARDLSRKGGLARQLGYAERTATKALAAASPMRR